MSRSRTLIFCRFYLILVIFLVECISGGHGIFGRKKDDRTFVTGTGSDLVIAPGDTVVTSLKANKRKALPPYRWMYAINKDLMIYYPPLLRQLFGRVKPVLTVRSKFAEKKLMNRGKKSGHVGLIGSYIAALMLESSKDFPFNLFFCNCKHYTEYLSRGRVKGGSWHKVMYHKMDKKCPLITTFDENMLKEIYHSKEFTMSDNKGGKIHMKINHWPHYVPPVTFH